MIQGFLSKVFKVREKVARDLTRQETLKRKRENPDWNPDDDHCEDEEKPFLEHLDDLRAMLVGMVGTLLLFMVLCFGFHRQLTDVLRYPLERAGLEHQLEQVEKLELASNPNINKDEKKHTDNVSLPPGTSEKFQKQAGEAGSDLPEVVLETAKNPLLREVYQIGNQPPVIGAAEGDLYYDMSVRQLKVFNGVAWNVVGDRVSRRFDLTTVDVTGVFMMSVKVSLFSAIVFSFPVLLYFLLQFVLPGLKRKEKRVLWPSLAVGFGLFIGGVLFAYFLVLPRALEFFYFWAQKQGVDTIWTIERYVTFATRFLLVFGISFELPVLVMALVKVDILNYSIMKGTRRHAIVAILIFSAIVTPTTDPGTLMLLSVPMCLLYEICIWIAYFMEKRDRALYPELYEAWDNAHEDTDRDPWEAENEREKGEENSASKTVVVSSANPVPFGAEEGELTLEEHAHWEQEHYGDDVHHRPQWTESQLMRKRKHELMDIAESLGCGIEGTKKEIVSMILHHY